MSGKLMLDVSSRRGDVNLFFLVDVLTKLHHPKGSVHDVYKESRHPLHEEMEVTMEVGNFSTLSHQKG